MKNMQYGSGDFLFKHFHISSFNIINRTASTEPVKFDAATFISSNTCSARLIFFFLKFVG